MARRTFAQYKAEVLAAIGNPDTSDLDIAVEDIVNDAIEHLAAMHTWRWLETGEVALNITAGQSFIVLPSDFGTLLSLQYAQSWADQMIATTWPELSRMRQEPVTAWTAGYWYVISTGYVGAPQSGLLAPRIELYPTPESDVAGAMQIVYRRHLRRLVADTDYPMWPAYMDRALSLLARGMAKTDYDEQPDNAYTQQFGQMIGDLMAHDGLSNKWGGRMRSGVAPRQDATPFGYPHNGIPDPTTV